MMGSHPQKRDSGQIVLPGEPLGVIEEFIPDIGTYVKDGVIYSKVIGRALIDYFNKRVSVFPLVRSTRVPKTGTIVVGQTSNVQTQMASLRIFKVGKHFLSGFFTGLLHVADVHLRFVDSMFDVCKPGDIVRARVISEQNRTYHLTTKDKSLGVIYAFCSQCGDVLQLRGRGGLQCPRCGNVEKRKTAIDYGKGII
ncbi:MAG: exosome complex RNA-binding protein Csl4 [Candidatus Bathyarchaeota archaeon]|nr:exosome complex RNA-binding protein Csl4 [Candidatus Bathyarchaeota archaeon]MDW8039927.1 exosome complex RNA-binding protein Csl4 [Nitrososphaerota archaeon]